MYDTPVELILESRSKRKEKKMYVGTLYNFPVDYFFHVGEHFTCNIKTEEVSIGRRGNPV